MRPFDRPRQLHVAVEGDAVLSLLNLWTTGRLELVSSDVIELEASKAPNKGHRDFILRLLRAAKSVVRSTPKILERARHLEVFGLDSFDAYHLASAEAGGVEFFVTCNDNLHERSMGITDSPVRVETIRSMPQILRDKLWS
jgi:hypothetical protein